MFGAEMSRAPVGHPRLRDQDDVTALAAVAAIGAPARHVGLSAKRGGSVASGSSRHQDADMVDEHGADDTEGGGPRGSGAD